MGASSDTFMTDLKQTDFKCTTAYLIVMFQQKHLNLVELPITDPLIIKCAHTEGIIALTQHELERISNIITPTDIDKLAKDITAINPKDHGPQRSFLLQEATPLDQTVKNLFIVINGNIEQGKKLDELFKNVSKEITESLSSGTKPAEGIMSKMKNVLTGTTSLVDKLKKIEVDAEKLITGTKEHEETLIKAATKCADLDSKIPGHQFKAKLDESDVPKPPSAAPAA